ncbi:hypothetical protein B566_EDAN018977 [Ephemera danica]|nr:hypothetical protein B566_EDAN018977 [Ephemera danica]
MLTVGPQGTPPKGWLPAPPLHNSSCSHPRFAAVTGSWGLSGVYATDAVQAAFVLALSAGVLGANLLLVLGLNARRYSRFIHAQPRYLLTSLAVNDLAIGLLVTPFAFLPSLLRCWPYGETFCQIQALLRGALSQQSAVILICMAIDRYMCMLHPVRYHRHSSKKVRNMLLNPCSLIMFAQKLPL